MNFRLTLGLVAAFLILGGGVWYTELRNPVTPTPPAGQATVFALNSADVSRAEVEADGKRAVVERGADNVWRLVEPQPGEADNLTVDSSVARLAKLNATRKLDNIGSLGDYGLTSPTIMLRLIMKDGSTNELQVGAKTPDGASYYTKRADADAVYVVSAFTVSDLTKWTTDPPKPRPTPSPLPTLPAPIASPSTTGG